MTAGERPDQVAEDVAGPMDGATRADAAVPADRATLGGVPLDGIALADAMAAIETACERRRPLRIVTVNLNFVTLARRHEPFRTALRTADLATVDGRIMLWLLRLAGHRAPEQVTGHDLVREVVVRGAGRGWRIFLLGGGPGVAERVAARLEREHRGLTVRGTDGGRFSPEGATDRQAEVEAMIRGLDPHVILVALGAPKQDLWLARHLETVAPAVGIGLGGVFDTLAGDLPRAPRWMQVAGLESLFQLLKRPRRYARRYLLDDPPTLVRLLAECLDRRARGSGGGDDGGRGRDGGRGTGRGAGADGAGDGDRVSPSRRASAAR